jgi:hypothetical protein
MSGIRAVPVGVGRAASIGTPDELGVGNVAISVGALAVKARINIKNLMSIRCLVLNASGSMVMNYSLQLEFILHKYTMFNSLTQSSFGC